MKIRYNAPVFLTFSLACTAVLVLSQIFPDLNRTLFSVPGNTTPFNFLSFDSIRLVTYIFGHAGWPHLIGNLSIILLAGPILEEKYGSGRMLVMILFTAIVTGMVNVLFLPTGSLGASGIAFMLILLISVTNVKQGEIPLTLFAIVAIFVTKEIFQMFDPNNNVNELAHLIGGFCGGLFGFIFAREKKIKDKGQNKPDMYVPPAGPGTIS
jgi:membrane associated rhomboid family serine protease